MKASEDKPMVGIIMGSRSDWGVMAEAARILTEFNVPREVEVVSAHRTPDKLFRYAETARERGLHVIIAGAGGAAHLPGMCAAKTSLPVLGVPVADDHSMLRGIDALLSIVQMPAGVPTATFAIGKAGAVNAALFAVSILALKFAEYHIKLEAYRDEQTRTVLARPDPRID